MSNPIPKGEIVKGNVLKHADDNYINALTLISIIEETGKQEIHLEIDRLEFHPKLIYSNGQTSINANLLYFKALKGWKFTEKPLELNKTNMDRICSMFGTIGANWEGKKIKLCIEEAYRPDIRMKGPCVRVKVDVRKGF